MKGIILNQQLPFILTLAVTVPKIEVLVDKILTVKKQNLGADTTYLGLQIDQLIYKLYDLTEE